MYPCDPVSASIVRPRQIVCKHQIPLSKQSDMVVTSTLPEMRVLMLHLAGRRNTDRRATARPGRGVNDGDCVAGALGHGLVKLHGVVLLLLLGSALVLRVAVGGGSGKDK